MSKFGFARSFYCVKYCQLSLPLFQKTSKNFPNFVYIPNIDTYSTTEVMLMHTQAYAYYLRIYIFQLGRSRPSARLYQAFDRVDYIHVIHTRPSPKQSMPIAELHFY